MISKSLKIDDQCQEFHEIRYHFGHFQRNWMVWFNQDLVSQPNRKKWVNAPLFRQSWHEFLDNQVFVKILFFSVSKYGILSIVKTNYYGFKTFGKASFKRKI